MCEQNEFNDNAIETLTVFETELIRSAVSQLKENNPNPVCQYDVGELVELLGTEIQYDFSSALALAESLCKKTIKIITGKDAKGNDNFIYFPWFSSIAYDNGIFRLRLNDELKRYLGLSK